MEKILIADLDRDYRELVIFTLRFAGYLMIGASSYDECLALSKEHKPDLILVGFDPPGMDAYETCAKLRGNPETSSIPVVFLLDPADAKLLKVEQSTCATLHLPKSLSPDELTREVSQFLQRSKR